MTGFRSTRRDFLATHRRLRVVGRPRMAAEQETSHATGDMDADASNADVMGCDANDDDDNDDGDDEDDDDDDDGDKEDGDEREVVEVDKYIDAGIAEKQLSRSIMSI